MKRRIILGLSGTILVAVLLLAGSSLGAYVRAQVEEKEAGSISCGDSVTCNRRNGSVVKVTNAGGGNAIWATTKSYQTNHAAVVGYAVSKARGVSGKSKDGYGVYGVSTNGSGVYGEHSTSGNCGYLGSSGTGVYGGSTSNWGVYGYSDSGTALCAASYSGNLIEGWAAGPYTLRFQVDNDGNVCYEGTLSASCADFAEMLPAAEGLEPADVLVVGPDGKLAPSGEAYSTAVVGVCSTKPAFVGGQGIDEDTTGKVPLAIMGIVPVKVSAENGAIQPGDLLTTSDTPGHAMKAIDPPNGTIIGKALESLESGTGTIQMLVTLQ